MKRRGKTNIIFDQTYSARNFNTSPVTVSGLKGDSYDYTVVIWGKSLGSIANLVLYPNSDTTTNYRLYQMSGGSSSASAYTSDAWATGVFFDLGWSASTANLAMCTITGSSGDERYFNSLYSCGHTTTYIRKASQYWKNTADELTSLQFKGSVNTTYDARIMIYRSPKIASQGCWQLIDTLSWSSETTEKTFSGLDGDSYKQYKIEWRGDQSLNVECNNDSGTNYVRQYLGNSGGTISAGNSTTFTSNRITDNSSLIINAESGVKRLSVSEGSRAGASFEQFYPVFWWSNTADNLTSLDCAPFASGSGTAKLYRAKNPFATADLLPFQTIKTVDVSAASIATVNNFNGDNFKLLKLEFHGNYSTTTNVNLRVDGDTGSNYKTQHLYGVNSTTVAYTQSSTSTPRIADNVNTEVSRIEVYLFPASGDNRPWLAKSYHGSSNYIQYSCGWWVNSVDEINSLSILPTTGNMTGTLTLSVLK